MRNEREQDILVAIRAVATADTSDFLELVRISGLDKRTDFKNADLSEMDLSGLDLREFNFKGALFHRSNLTGTNLKGTGFSLVNAIGAETNGETIADELEEGQIYPGSIASRISVSRRLLLKALSSCPNLVETLQILLERGYSKEIPLSHVFPWVGEEEWRPLVREGRDAMIVVDQATVDLQFASAEQITGVGFSDRTRGAVKARTYEIVRDLSERCQSLIRFGAERAISIRSRTKVDPSLQSRYLKERDEISEVLYLLRLRNDITEQLSEQLYADTSELVRSEKELMSSAEDMLISRAEFWSTYKSFGFDEGWVTQAKDTRGEKWQGLFDKFSDEVQRNRQAIRNAEAHTSMPIVELKSALDSTRSSTREINAARRDLFRASHYLIDEFSQTQTTGFSKKSRMKAEEALRAAANNYDARLSISFQEFAATLIRAAVIGEQQA